MKIGIYTVPIGPNYGGILQAYALQKILGGIGHEVIRIDRVPLKKKSLNFKRVVEIVKRTILKYYFHKKIRIFGAEYENKVRSIIETYTSSFINSHIKSVQVNDVNDFDFNNFDAIIVGSDQIWRYAYNAGEELFNYYLSFVKGMNIRKIAYAASFGTDVWEYPKEDVQICKTLLQKFDAVSVREKSGVELCKEHFGVDVEFVLDPTMLLDKKDYIDIIQNENTIKSNGNLMLCVLDKENYDGEIISFISNNLDLVPFSLNLDLLKDTFAPLKNRILPPVGQWLRGFYDADFIITDSFHACVFSILFGKPFIAIGNESRGMARFSSLLSLFGLEDRLVLGKFNGTIPSSSMSEAQQKLIGLREKSISFLKNALSK